MYNFFKNRTSKKAFIQALREIEKEGYFVSRQTNDDVVFTTNMSRAVAALSNDKIDIRPVVDKTLDISGYTPNSEWKPEENDSQGQIVLQTPVEELKEQEALNTDNSKKQSRVELYEKLFSDDAFLDGRRVQERGLLSNEIEEGSTGDDIRLKALNTEKQVNDNNSKRISATKQRIKELNAIIIARKKQAEKNVVHVSTDDNVVLKDNASQQTKTIEQLDQPITEDPKLVVEVVASKDKKEEPKQKIDIPIDVVSVAKMQPKTTTKKQTKTTASTKKRKKKRRFDADIAGGFDF